MSKIKLNSGIYFDFANPTKDMVLLKDIIHNNSKEQRFGNCLDKDWSVLHHSLLVYKLSELYGDDYKSQYAALHHDSPEAYMKDIPTPLKKMLSDYNKIYKKVEQAVEEKLQVKISDSFLYKFYDQLAMFIEDTLFSDSESSWHEFTEDSIKKLSDELDGNIQKEINSLYILRTWQVSKKYLEVHNTLAEKLNLKNLIE